MSIMQVLLLIFSVITLSSSAYEKNVNDLFMISPVFENKEMKTILPPPRLLCSEVLDNGNVIITWEIPDDPDSYFHNYQIYHSNNLSGPFSIIDTIYNYNQTGYQHIGANAQTQQNYYYATTASDIGGDIYYSSNSDTIASMLLNLINSNNGIAEISWNEVFPNSSPSSQFYYIYREYMTTWELIDSTTNTYYSDTILLCNANYKYKINKNNTGCVSVSSTKGDAFQNIIPPDTPVLDSVSVNFNQQLTELGWQPSLASDVNAYIIYKFITPAWVPIDTVEQTYYLNTNSTPYQGSEAYRIAAIDNCGNTSPIGTEHRTIYLILENDICNNSINLNWTHYVGFASNLLKYEIWVKQNAHEYILHDITSAETQTYQYSSLNDTTDYCFFVKAVNTDNIKTSSSNISCERVVFPNQPDVAYLRYVSVVNNNDAIKLAMFVDSPQLATSYKVQRKKTDDADFSTIVTITATSNSEFVYYDNDVLTEKYSYEYRFIVLDSCYNEAITSNIAQTILLEGEQGVELFSNILRWNDYFGWENAMEKYDIYRIEVKTLLPLNIAQVPAGILEYTDIFSNEAIMSDRTVKYFAEALELFENSYGYRDSARSNILSIEQPPRLYVANAFAPEGENRIFKPYGSFIAPDNYFFAVYNRMGLKVFSTTNIEEGWDGKYKGNIVPGGTHVYYIRLYFFDGQLFEKRGIVTVVR